MMVQGRFVVNLQVDCRCDAPVIVPDFSPVRAVKNNENAIIGLQFGGNF
jgi:hypothetical protein